jgi:hypothetical protein
MPNQGLDSWCACQHLASKPRLALRTPNGQSTAASAQASAGRSCTILVVVSSELGPRAQASVSMVRANLTSCCLKENMNQVPSNG